MITMHPAFQRLLSSIPTLMLAATASNAGIIVPGTSNPWLAGQPDGTTAQANDSAPGQSPVLVSGIAGGTILTFFATGSASNTPFLQGYTPENGPVQAHSGGAENGIAGLTAPLSSLVGVFLGNSVPGPTGIPSELDFGTIGLNFTSLHPELRQPFFIGDGRTDSAVTQQFFAPLGATRLYLGTMDGFEWNNNSGELDVNPAIVVPEPGEYAALAGLGLAGFALYRRLR